MLQWYLRTMDTVGTGLLSVVGRLSLSQRLLNVCYNRLVASTLSIPQMLSASQSVHYQRLHCIITIRIWFTDVEVYLHCLCLLVCI